MAIKLTKKEVSERDDLAGNLRQAMEDFESAREVLRAFVEGDTTVPADQTVAYNDQITGAANEALAKLMVAIEEAENFRDALAIRLRDEYDEKSEKWQEGDKGSEADSFISEWESADFEIPDLDSTAPLGTEYNESMADDLEALPEAPE